MNEKIFSYFTSQIGFAATHQCLNPSDVKLIKQTVNENYSTFAQVIYDKLFLNWGLWNQNINNEYLGLNFDFSSQCGEHAIYQQLLLYYLIRPLIHGKFFNKRLLDVGCGNGLGLKASSVLLKTQYALGVDLVSKLATNAHRNFYKNNELNIIQSDAEILPLANESFDIITNLESSHLYPNIKNFFAEVARVLAPGGYFCYTDLQLPQKMQNIRLDEFLQGNENLKIVAKRDITKMIQASIYKSVIGNEEMNYHYCRDVVGSDKVNLLNEFKALSTMQGIGFLPWWKIWFKNPELRFIAKYARRTKDFGKRCYFYYLIQKVKK